MKKTIKLIAISAIALTMAGCANDFLDQDNTYQLSQESFFDSDEAVDAAVKPLYSYVWYDFNDKFSYAMGDGRANNITAQYSKYIYPYTNFEETSLTDGLTEAWASLYSVVAQANNTINNIVNYGTDNISESAFLKAMAEARFMRGLAYWYIGSLWGRGIIYENTGNLVSNYVVPAQPRTDVIEFAIRDMEYAAVYLPETQSGEGRVNKYAAYGMLSRMYLSMAGLVTEGRYDQTNAATDFNRGTRNEYYLNMAKKAAEKVIDESGATLLDYYGDLFDITTIDNNEESLFQLQFMPGTDMGGAANSMERFLSWSTMIGSTNWGGATYCSWNLWQEFKEYEDETLGITVDDATRRHYCVASYGESYPELSASGDDDPYVYGITENPGNQGANIKKYVVGTNKINGISVVGNSGTNVYMLRLAEVYLNYVEAVMGNNSYTTDAEALELFNEIRTRADMPKKSRITWEDLRHEYRVEFAFEGQYWYQLLRRSYYNQQEVVNYLNNQQRNASYYTASTHTYELDKDYAAPGPSVSLATASSLVLPIADADQTKNPYLKTSDNESWVFEEREVTDDQLFD